MKGKILQLLSPGGEIVSGERLSTELGISRVSIWKHIKALQELGYGIASTPKGYRLENTPDVPYSWEFPNRESSIIYFPKVPSTMAIARERAAAGAAHLTVVVADQQTAGRGRLKRNWLSTPGGLYVTLILRPQLPPTRAFRISFAAALDLALTLQAETGVEARVKWPNDIRVDGKKLVGILSEMEAEADMVHFLNIGIGINVNNDPTPKEPGATSLKKILGRPVSRKVILGAFLDRFEARMARGIGAEVISEWKSHSDTLGRRVKVVTARETSEGMAIDVDDTGALVMALDTGETRTVIYGDCFHR